MAPNAVLIATVWSSIGECVGYKCLADAVLQTLGDSTEAGLYAPFSYFNSDILKTTVEAVGFNSVSVQVVDNFVSFPSIKNFVWHRVYGSPLINNLPKNNHEEIINKIVQKVESSLKSYEGKDGLIFQLKQII